MPSPFEPKAVSGHVRESRAAIFDHADPDAFALSGDEVLDFTFINADAGLTAT